MEKIMAVLTGERIYGERLCAYANHRRNMPFTAVSFDSGAAYRNFASKHKIGVLLTDGHLEKGCFGVRDSPPGQQEELIIGLFDETDDDSVFNYSEGPGLETYTLIPKYQSAEKIMRSVMSCCSAMGCPASFVSRRCCTSVVSSASRRVSSPAVIHSSSS